MREHEDTFDPQHPALIVTYGSTRKKCRPLDRDVFLLGRAPGCDLGLVSPEVAPAHCVLVRLPEGWRVRDCSGRGATLLNGESVHESPLQDGDILHVGSFSFRVHLPRQAGQPVPAESAPASPTAGQSDRDHLKRSRRNLAHHALRLRRQLTAYQEGAGELEQRQAELQGREERLRSLVRDHEARAARVEQERRAVAAAQEELRRQQEELRRQQQNLAARQQDLTELQAEVERGGRELEQQYARERARMAAERAELNQRREQVREEIQRQRQELDSSRQELAQRAQGEPKAAPARDLSELERLRESARNRLASFRRLQEAASRRPNAPGTPLSGPHRRIPSGKEARSEERP